MTAFLAILLLFAEVMTLIWAIRRSGLLPFPHGTMVYLIGSQIVLILHATGLVYYDFLRIFTTYAYIHHLQEMLLLDAALFFMLVLCVPRNRISIAEQVRRIAVRNEVLMATVAAVYLSNLYLFLCFRWDLIWYNRIYLTIVPEFSLETSNFVSVTLFQMYPMIGLAAVAAAVYAFYANRKQYFLLLLPFAAWHVLFAIASHSRYSVVYFLLAGLLAAILSKSKPAALILVLLGIMTHLSVLEGRNTGHHGLSSLPFYFENFYTFATQHGFDALSNFFEGAFVTAEYFGREFHYATIYKVLSLSPLISSIDGYAAVREVFAIPLHDFVPNSAVSEVLSFGIVYAAIFFSVQLLAGRISAELMSRRPGVGPLILNSTVLLGSYLQFAYSTRTVFRVFVYALIICLIIRYRSGRATAPPSRVPVDQAVLATRPIDRS